MKRIVGLFKKEEDADSAINQLLAAGFNKNQFGLASHNTIVQEVNYKEDKEQGSIQAENKLGGTGGAAVGGITGLFLSAALVAVPGVGPMLAVGSIATAISSVVAATGMGTVAGGLLGALTSLGISQKDAEVYTQGVKSGNILLIVDAEDLRTDLVKDIMQKANAVHIKTGQKTTEPLFDQ